MNQPTTATFAQACSYLEDFLRSTGQLGKLEKKQYGSTLDCSNYSNEFIEYSIVSEFDMPFIKIKSIEISISPILYFLCPAKKEDFDTVMDILIRNTGLV